MNVSARLFTPFATILSLLLATLAGSAPAQVGSRWRHTMPPDLPLQFALYEAEQTLRADELDPPALVQQLADRGMRATLDGRVQVEIVGPGGEPSAPEFLVSFA